MRLRLSVVIAFLAISACDNPATNVSRAGRGKYRISNAGFANSIELWSESDVGHLELVEGTIQCGGSLPASETFRWYYYPEGSGHRPSAWGSWDMGAVECSKDGKASLELTYLSTGEVIPTTEGQSQGNCTRFKKRLPGRETWLQGSPHPDIGELPEGLALPEVMPVVAYETVGGCG